MFDQIRQAPVGVEITPPVRVEAVKDLFWSDGEKEHLHAKAGEQGTILYRTGPGIIVRFDSGEVRQVFDFEGTMPPKVYRAEDEIKLVA